VGDALAAEDVNRPSLSQLDVTYRRSSCSSTEPICCGLEVNTHYSLTRHPGYVDLDGLLDITQSQAGLLHGLLLRPRDDVSYQSQSVVCELVGDQVVAAIGEGNLLRQTSGARVSGLARGGAFKGVRVRSGRAAVTDR